jgi:hypothetical protein
MRILILLSILLICGCGNNHPADQPLAYMLTTVDNLRLRAAPNKSAKILATLKKNTRLVYLHEESAQKDSIKIQGQTTVLPWHKVKLDKSDLTGWVFGGGVKNVSEQVIPETPDCNDATANQARALLDGVLQRAGLKGQYALSCQTKPFWIEGDFNSDQVPDIAILIERTADHKAGILFAPKDASNGKPTIFGAGTKAFDMDNYNWIGVFEKVSAGTTIMPNFNEETQDFYLEGETVPKDKIVRLTSDAIFVHQNEACGGGYSYWKDGGYHWMQNE